MTPDVLTADAPAARPPTRERLLDPKLLIGILVVAGLLVVSLFTGVYDVVGGQGGREMFAITRVRAPSPWCSPGPPWPCPGWSCSC